MDCKGNKWQLFPLFRNLFVQPSLCFHTASRQTSWIFVVSMSKQSGPFSRQLSKQYQAAWLPNMPQYYKLKQKKCWPTDEIMQPSTWLCNPNYNLRLINWKLAHWLFSPSGTFMPILVFLHLFVFELRVSEWVGFNVPPDTVYVISETAFSGRMHTNT